MPEIADEMIDDQWERSFNAMAHKTGGSCGGVGFCPLCDQEYFDHLDDLAGGKP